MVLFIACCSGSGSGPFASLWARGRGCGGGELWPLAQREAEGPEPLPATDAHRRETARQDSETMANDLEAKGWEAVKAVRFPGMSRDIVSFGFVHDVKVSDGGEVEVSLQMATHNPEAAEKVRAEAERAVRAVPGAAGARVAIQMQKPAGPAGQDPAAQRATSQNPNLAPGVRHMVAVASGKGGVGKVAC